MKLLLGGRGAMGGSWKRLVGTRGAPDSPRGCAERPGAQSRRGHGARAGPRGTPGRGPEHRAGAQELRLSSEWRTLTTPESKDAQRRDRR